MPDNKEELTEACPFETAEDLVGHILRDLYYCNRVWSAWSYGTMGQDDFILAGDDDDIFSGAADDIKAFSTRRPDKELIEATKRLLDYIEIEFEDHINRDMTHGLDCACIHAKDILAKYKKGE